MRESNAKSRRKERKALKRKMNEKIEKDSRKENNVCKTPTSKQNNVHTKNKSRKRKHSEAIQENKQVSIDATKKTSEENRTTPANNLPRPNTRFFLRQSVDSLNKKQKISEDWSNSFKEDLPLVKFGESYKQKEEFDPNIITDDTYESEIKEVFSPIMNALLESTTNMRRWEREKRKMSEMTEKNAKKEEHLKKYVCKTSTSNPNKKKKNRMRKLNREIKKLEKDLQKEVYSKHNASGTASFYQRSKKMGRIKGYMRRALEEKISKKEVIPPAVFALFLEQKNIRQLKKARQQMNKQASMEAKKNITMPNESPSIIKELLVTQTEEPFNKKQEFQLSEDGILIKSEESSKQKKIFNSNIITDDAHEQLTESEIKIEAKKQTTIPNESPSIIKELLVTQTEESLNKKQKLSEDCLLIKSEESPKQQEIFDSNINTDDTHKQLTESEIKIDVASTSGMDVRVSNDIFEDPPQPQSSTNLRKLNPLKIQQSRVQTSGDLMTAVKSYLSCTESHKKTENTQVGEFEAVGIAFAKKLERMKRTQANFAEKRKQSDCQMSGDLMTACTEALKQTGKSQVGEFDAVGISIAKKLERMEPSQAIFAESIINDVMKRGLMKTLQESTGLCGSYWKNTSAQTVSSGTSENEDNI